ncbi:3-phytase [Sinobacterium caligoides]|uniref:3-phytase n=1 Tax=Sinobacterium caligoides TaxID=933926 RepID=A0A3N2D5F5_9GAMM|nr:phytase [Sinobacterium caligoides]ROR94922.1 3-phytase [Sinobacterium caligoides]
MKNKECKKITLSKNKKYSWQGRLAAGVVLPGLLLSLSACQMGQQGDVATQAGAVLKLQPLAGDIVEPSLAKLLQMPDGEQRWLLASESEGLLVTAASGKVLQRIEGHYEAFDLRDGVTLAREGNSQHDATVVLTVDASNNTPKLLTLEAGQLSLLADLKAPGFQIDQLCLFRDRSDNLYANFLGGRGHNQQWLIYDGQQQQVKQRLVRDLPLPVESTFCSVDDASQTLYVSEEGFGLWAYQANPEAEAERELIDLAAPRGTVTGDLAGIQAFAGGVYALDVESAELHRYDAVDGGYTLNASWQLQSEGDQALVPEKLTLSASAGSQTADEATQLVVYDDETGGLFTASFVDQPPAAKALTAYPEVQPLQQTEPMHSFGDAADDPAIWVNSRDKRSSRILATNKRLGLEVFDLEGKAIQRIALGPINNIDIRYGMTLQGKVMDVAAATLRSDNSIALFTIDPQSGVVHQAGSIATDLKEIYGSCMYQNRAGENYVFINDKDGRFQQYQLHQQASVKPGGPLLTGSKVREFSLDSQPEGCVVDDQNDRLFVGEEDHAVWVYGAAADAGQQGRLLAKVGDVLVDDIEGIALYIDGAKGYLVVSSQGDNSYAVYDRLPPYAYRGSFRVGLNAHDGIDGASETDGLEVSSTNFGGAFAQGMLVVQDGRNVMPLAPQNFKYIAWQDIAKALNL